VPPLSPYLPGETLDPNCSPGDPNCTVLPSLTGTSTPGNIAFYLNTTTLTGTSDLFWDNNSKKLGIGTTTPSEKLTVLGNLSIVGENNFLFINRGKKDISHNWYRGFIYLGKDLDPSEWITPTMDPIYNSSYLVLGVDTDIGAFMPVIYDTSTLTYVRAANIEGSSGIFQGDLYLQKSEGSTIFFKPGGNFIESFIKFDNLNKKLSLVIATSSLTPFEFRTENPVTGNFLSIFNSSTNILYLSSDGNIFVPGFIIATSGFACNDVDLGCGWYFRSKDITDWYLKYNPGLPSLDLSLGQTEDSRFSFRIGYLDSSTNIYTPKISL